MDVNHQEQVTTHEIRVVCRFLDEHLHKITRRHLFLNPVFAGSMNTSQFLFNQT